MTALTPEAGTVCLETDDNCDSRKLVSKHLYPVTEGGSADVGLCACRL
jgi:hypothetical protein